MNGIMTLALECTNRNENLRTGLTRCARCRVVIQSDCEIEVDQETVVLLLSEHDISKRDIKMENTGIQ